MSLQEILFGTWEPPLVIHTTKHRIGFSSKYGYIPKIKTQRKQKPKESEEKILRLMKRQTEPVTPGDISKKTPWTRNHCGMIMASLWKQGLLKRQKLKLQNTRTYIYFFVEINKND